MTKAQEFSIKVQSEDPNEKDKPEDEKLGSSMSAKNLKGSKKEGDGEELVCVQFLSKWSRE